MKKMFWSVVVSVIVIGCSEPEVFDPNSKKITQDDICGLPRVQCETDFGTPYLFPESSSSLGELPVSSSSSRETPKE